MIKISSALEAWLRTQPEYKMGMQKGVVTLSNGGIERGIIINSEVFVPAHETIPWELYLDDWAAVQKEIQKTSLSVVKVELIPREPESLKGVKQVFFANEKNSVLANRKQQMASNFSNYSEKDRLLRESRELMAKAASAGANSAPITLTSAGDIFKRFSAYVNDHRITPGWGLTVGTFATTKDDADKNIKTGTDAVSRYALPNPKPATNVFTISPPKDTDLQQGTVQPANGQTGGGVEVIFVKGSPDGTVSGPTTIPAK